MCRFALRMGLLSELSFVILRRVNKKLSQHADMFGLGNFSCMYWGGVTANGWGGPRPGETIEPIGSCTVPHVQATPTANAVKEDLIMIGE